MAETTLDSLNLFRRAHTGAALRANVAWRLIGELRDCTVTLPYESTVQFLAQAIYYNAGYDAGERHASVDEFELVLREELGESNLEQAEVNGVKCWLLKPFFTKDSGYLSQLKLSYLRDADPQDYKELGGAVPALVQSVPTNLSPDELDALVAYHRGATVRLVNKLRNLWTVSCYMKTGLENAAENKYSAYPAHTMDVRAAGLVAALASTCDLAFEPKPSSYFGSEADRVNKLHTLAADESTLAPLLQGI